MSEFQKLSSQIKNDLREIKEGLEDMKETLEAVGEAQEPVNEGDIRIDELFALLEAYRHKTYSDPKIESSRDLYNRSQAALQANQEQLDRTAQEIEEFEAKIVRLTKGRITRSQIKRFRETSNQCSVWFGKFEATLQYTAAAGVVFQNAIKDTEGN